MDHGRVFPALSCMETLVGSMSHLGAIGEEVMSSLFQSRDSLLEEQDPWLMLQIYRHLFLQVRAKHMYHNLINAGAFIRNHTWWERGVGDY